MPRLLAGLIVAAMLAVVPAQPAMAAPPLEWGIDVKPGQANMDSIESAVGRKAASTRVFLKWNSPFPDTYHNYLGVNGHTLMISVRPQYLNGAKILWKDLARPGTRSYTELLSWVEKIKAFQASYPDSSVTFTLHHEPETVANSVFGTAADYTAAWVRVVQEFRNRAVNVKFYWIMTAHSFRRPLADRQNAANWYPGDSYVDVIASDAYNWYTCRHDVSSPWKSLVSLIKPMRDFGAARSKAMYLTEYASVEDPQVPGRKAQWLSDAQALFKTPEYALFTGVAYFNLNGPNYPACGWPVTSSDSALAAFRTMGLDPAYAG